MPTSLKIRSTPILRKEASPRRALSEKSLQCLRAYRRERVAQQRLVANSNGR